MALHTDLNGIDDEVLASDTVHYGWVAAAALLSALPEVILALLIQKHLVRGLSFGAVKG